MQNGDEAFAAPPPTQLPMSRLPYLRSPWVVHIKVSWWKCLKVQTTRGESTFATVLVECSGSDSKALDWGTHSSQVEALHRRSHCAVSFEQDTLSAHRIVLTWVKTDWVGRKAPKQRKQNSFDLYTISFVGCFTDEVKSKLAAFSLPWLD